MKGFDHVPHGFVPDFQCRQLRKSTQPMAAIGTIGDMVICDTVQKGSAD